MELENLNDNKTRFITQKRDIVVTTTNMMVNPPITTTIITKSRNTLRIDLKDYSPYYKYHILRREINKIHSGN